MMLGSLSALFIPLSCDRLSNLVSCDGPELIEHRNRRNIIWEVDAVRWPRWCALRGTNELVHLSQDSESKKNSQNEIDFEIPNKEVDNGDESHVTQEIKQSEQEGIRVSNEEEIEQSKQEGRRIYGEEGIEKSEHEKIGNFDNGETENEDEEPDNECILSSTVAHGWVPTISTSTQSLLSELQFSKNGQKLPKDGHKRFKDGQN
ncbi:hypothetical protein FNV43_RR26511 [Rhamnella rubrinervis]|uniref:Uncharacterized protein n=1 Tax=Rhamnella rubrinervis TaxID=2594499 RepID=A0A8K0DQ01_9ROSA|nr:hypothetical protein FNV43_RR26511 [Rhamnella rubrinervis]